MRCAGGLILGLMLGWALAVPAAAQNCPAVAAPTLSLPQARQAVQQWQVLTIIAFGSSSTEGAGASGPSRTYPSRLEARLRAMLPDVPLRVLNRGIGGQEVGEMLGRLATDVLSAAPQLVVWQAGANAVLRGMPADEFRAAMAHGILQLRLAGIEVELMDSQRAPRIMEHRNYPLFDASLVELAAGQGISLFSRAEVMLEWQQMGLSPAELLAPDGLHHNDRGYDCVAAVLARSIASALKAPAQSAAR